MAYPVRTLVRPAVLAGQANGRLPTRILDTTPGQAGGLAVQLVKPAARAWRALSAAASDAGHVLKLSGAGCGYRSYEVQERIFRQRYTTTYLAGRPYKTWNEVRWYQRLGTAVAAVPGTSNHGWGLAVDVGEERDSDLDTEPLDSGTLAWLLANEERFGWSHELQSEPWHLRYFTGDRIPQAVLDHERPDTEGDDVKNYTVLIIKDKGFHVLTPVGTRIWIPTFEDYAGWVGGGANETTITEQQLQVIPEAK